MAQPPSSRQKSIHYADPRIPDTFSLRARAVCLIQLEVMGGKRSLATGFLIGRDLIMTNNHMLPSIDS